VFALAVFFSDDYLALSKNASSNERRFFVILRKLPMEIQMILSNRQARVSRDIVSTQLTELSLQKFARLFATSEQ